MKSISNCKQKGKQLQPVFFFCLSLRREKKKRKKTAHLSLSTTTQSFHRMNENARFLPLRKESTQTTFIIIKGADRSTAFSLSSPCGNHISLLVVARQASLPVHRANASSLSLSLMHVYVARRQLTMILFFFFFVFFSSVLCNRDDGARVSTEKREAKAGRRLRDDRGKVENDAKSGSPGIRETVSKSK